MSDYGSLSADGARLLRQARDHIAAHPKEFDMTHWGECGTVACIGGFCMLGGWRSERRRSGAQPLTSLTVPLVSQRKP